MSWQGSAWVGNPPADNALIDFTLQLLREKTHADVALMQKRDFYLGPSHNAWLNNADAEGIERVFWTGGFLHVVTVSGDTLKKVLKESDFFDQQDIQATQEKTEFNRGLYTHGIRKTEDGLYVVDGDLLNRNGFTPWPPAITSSPGTPAIPN